MYCLPSFMFLGIYLKCSLLAPRADLQGKRGLPTQLIFHDLSEHCRAVHIGIHIAHRSNKLQHWIDRITYKPQISLEGPAFRYRQLGEWDQSGNRFMSCCACVRVCARSGCQMKIQLKRGGPSFSLFLFGARKCSLVPCETMTESVRRFGTVWASEG